MPCDSLHQPVSLAEAARKHFPGNPNPSTVWRWATKGHSDGRGGRIRLEITYVGRRAMVTPAACADFIDAVTKAKLARHMQTDEEPSTERSDETERRLVESNLI